MSRLSVQSCSFHAYDKPDASVLENGSTHANENTVYDAQHPCSCSSYCHTWDVFQFAHASFRLHCIQSNLVLHDNTLEVNDKLGPNLLGEPPNISATLPEMGPEDDEESASGDLPAVKIYDDDINMRFLVCRVASSLDAFLLGSVEDGLNALLVGLCVCFTFFDYAM
ncbi:AT-rich interactive domain-containing 4 [Olea europaea subsp. europaea]|uniref:AT-rich interactive domain-containing 4 n=1 Tax=Olea europaea subsp. europaea TaxID=158383 RepID=A0A8S0Q7R2_OLEEU|nr:AT-rich interactive domain-containing 4 [Olea europaea subsp. europaea]